MQIKLLNYLSVNRTLIRRFWPFGLILLLLSFVYLNSIDNVNTQHGAQCELIETQTCVATLDGREFAGRLLQNPQVEEELQIELIYPSQYDLQQSYIQGINMYMGQTALLNTSMETDAERIVSKNTFFLGACSERNMRWQLVLLFVNAASGDEKRVFFNFETQY
ncbi:hypothetical protein GCM10011274_20170 [Paraglaciecola chathamensis]|uniref:Uncharacterized protein n=1 Tax=Paraglaciecola chathamensis TaxID=368405 RepID=A0A8H9I9C8_9ALTE|nr:hypothetical protein GCM10011274_20170 [Paraglaciecola oceanifecundans]